MEQVSGRAGRKDGKGTVLVQVSNTNHPVLQFVKEHDFTRLFAFEIENRKRFDYPPFTRLIQVIFKHREKHIAEEAANIMMQGLKADFGAECNGPAQPVVDRVRNQYIWEILIKLPKNTNRINLCKKEIKQQTIIIQSNKRYRGVTILPDVDPV
jgi:primosomal protein N' (replication factor Y)